MAPSAGAPAPRTGQACLLPRSAAVRQYWTYSSGRRSHAIALVASPADAHKTPVCDSLWLYIWRNANYKKVSTVPFDTSHCSTSKIWTIFTFHFLFFSLSSCERLLCWVLCDAHSHISTLRCQKPPSSWICLIQHCQPTRMSARQKLLRCLSGKDLNWIFRASTTAWAQSQSYTPQHKWRTCCVSVPPRWGRELAMI